MEGVVIIVITLLIAFPVAVLISGGVAAALLSTVIQRDVDKSNEGSELLKTNY